MGKTIYRGGPVPPKLKRYLVKHERTFPDGHAYGGSKQFRTKWGAMGEAEWRRRSGFHVEVIDRWK